MSTAHLLILPSDKTIEIATRRSILRDDQSTERKLVRFPVENALEIFERSILRAVHIAEKFVLRTIDRAFNRSLKQEAVRR